MTINSELVRSIDSNSLNLSQTPLGISGDWTMERLLLLTPADAVSLWRDSPAPSIAEMNGHYLGLRPTAELNGNALYFDEKSEMGYWLGKAFRPAAQDRGEGYNRFRKSGGVIERYSRMETYVGPSPVDGKTSFIIDYSRFNPAISMLDDLRRLDAGVYIGVATYPDGAGHRTAPEPFLLVGPTDSWVGPDRD